MDAVVGWLVLGLIAFGIWRLKRAFVRMAQEHNQRRSEAFSAAVSEAVASGVATALSAAVADATAAATGGHVAVHIGDNLASLIADNYDRGNDHDNDRSAHHDNNRLATVPESLNRRGVGSLPDSTRRRELASGRTLRNSAANRIGGGNAHSVTVSDE